MINSSDSNNTNNFFLCMLAIMLKFLVSFAACFICFELAFGILTAHAQTLIDHPDDFEVPWVDKEEYPYYASFYSEDRNYKDDKYEKYTQHYTGADFYSKYPVFAVYNSVNQGYFLKCYNPTTQQILMCGATVKHIFPIYAYHKAEDQDGKQVVFQNYPNDGFWSYGTSPYVKNPSAGPSINAGGDYSFTCNVYVFDSDESAIKYYRDGDLSGIISRPDPDYDYDHDFREDVYDASIPMPELSNLSHNGFHVNNADPTRDIEIYIESTFYGLKHNTSGSTVETDATSRPILFTYDSSWVIGTHRFNLINTDISYSDADINIKEMFKCDNVGALIKDFKKWSNEYPKHEKLPDYTWYKFQNDHYTNDYRNYHLYSHSVGKTEEEKLKLSAQASTTYRVRFCQYVPGEGYTWGKWATYIYTPAGYGHKDNTTVGDTEADPDTGRPIIKDPKPGLQDPDGNITFPDKFAPSNLGEMIEDVMGTLQGMSSFFGEFPAFLASTFAFIPAFIWAIIGAGLIFVIIVTIIKAVLSLK